MASLHPFTWAWPEPRPRERQLVYRGPVLPGLFLFHCLPLSIRQIALLKKVIF
jgi:membrane-bound metal-dependent hydrolase YbcI (DUF457 family)